MLRNSHIMAFIGSLLRLASLALALVLSGVLWGLTQAPSSSTHGEYDEYGDAVTTQQQALAAWEALWARLDAQGVAALNPVPPDRARRAAGDTVFMRYPNLWGQIDESERLAFQLAAISGDPEQKLAVLEPATRSPTPLIRFRALLERARIQRRQRDLSAASATARAALAVPEVSEQIRADAWFLLADSAWEQGQRDAAETALNAAIAADPGFWEARRVRLDVLAQRLSEPRQRGALCLDRTRRMIEDLAALPTLAEDHTQFRDLADRFARAGVSSSVALTLIAGLGYHWSGDVEQARRTLEQAALGRGALPIGCEQLIMERIANWRTRLATPDATP